MKELFIKWLTLLTALICALGNPSVARAASDTDRNLQDCRKCTARVTVVDQDIYHRAKPVYIDGARLSLVKVANLNADGSYTLREDFKGLAGWEDYISGSESSDRTKTAQDAMAKAVAGNVQAADAVTTDRDGSATLTTDAGDYGIYLLYESDRSEGSTAQEYMDIVPVLIEMPMHKDNQWIFDQTDVNPKIVKDATVTIRKRSGDATGAATDEAVIHAHLEIVSADQPDQVLDEWNTTDVDHDSVPLESGKYILEETSAPEGFDLAEPIPFEVRSDGKLLIGDVVQSGNEIVMVDPVKAGTDGNADNGDPGDGGTDERPSGRRTVLESVIRAVRTGDPTNIAMWIALLVAAVCLIVVIVRRNRK